MQSLYNYIIYTDILHNKDMNIGTELLKCPNHPQGSNGSTYGFKCCHQHVCRLIQKGLKCHQIDNYINWRWCKNKIESIQDKIKKLKENDNNYQNEKNRLIDKIKQINNYIKKKYNHNDIKIFNDVLHYNHVRRTSPRKKTQKQKADYNECMIIENDNETLNQWEQITHDKVHPDYVHFKHRMSKNL